MPQLPANWQEWAEDLARAHNPRYPDSLEEVGDYYGFITTLQMAFTRHGVPLREIPGDDGTPAPSHEAPPPEVPPLPSSPPPELLPQPTLPPSTAVLPTSPVLGWRGREESNGELEPAYTQARTALGP